MTQSAYRVARGAVLASALLWSACVTPSSGVTPSNLLTVTARADAAPVLVLMPDAASARETLRGMSEELGDDFKLMPRIVSESTDPNDLVQMVRSERPEAIVVMNNPILRLFRRYRVVAPPAQRAIPAVSILTSFLRETSAGVENLTGVIYEVPLVTSLTNLRVLIEQPLKRVGVLYRPIFAEFLAEQKKLSQAEGFDVVGVQIDDTKPRSIEKALDRLREEMKVDAIWVLNDNVLLKPELLVEGWLPALRRNRTPIIVNVRSLLSRDVNFGTFAVVPDHRGLGSQAGQLVASIADAGWKLTFPGEFEYPIAVEKVLDLDFARQYLALREGQLESVDKLVQ